MKILIASGTFHPEIGGPPTYLYALCRTLVERGHAVRVVTHGHNEQPYPYRVVRVPRELPAPARLARFTLEVVRHGRGADVVYANDYGLPPALANLLLRRPLAMKVVGDFAWEYAVRHGLISPETTIDEFQQRRYGRSVERPRAMQRWYVGRAHAVIVPSEYLRGIVAGWGVRPERLRVIYNAPPPGPARSKAEARTLLGVAPEARVVAVLARLTPWKGVDHLIEALVGMSADGTPTTLLVAGDGPERERLERLAAPLDGAARFLGELPREQALAALAAADVVALPSSYEGLSHVLLEAMQAGRTIVASAAGGNRELIRDGENGLLVPYGDVAALAAALRRVFDDPALASRLAETAAREARERSWERLVDSTLEVFRELAGATDG